MLMKVRALTLAAGLLAALLSAAPAHAAENTAADAARAQQAADLKQDCAQHTEASQPRGWARSRFEQCYHYYRKVFLYDAQTGAQKGQVEFDLWVLGFATDGARRVDYVVSVENVKQSVLMNDALTFLTITLEGCGNRQDVTCTGTFQRRDTIAGWYAKPLQGTATVTSPDDAGQAPFGTVRFDTSATMFLEYLDGRTIPWSEQSGNNTVRFDSAGQALGNGKFKGTVFTDNVPTLALSLTHDNINQEARHVDDALHHPERTFPSFVGKNPPGEKTPLHRLMNSADKDLNHGASVGICKDVWGPDYASGGLECDEYPFQSTYEGSYTSTSGKPAAWHGSARPIDGGDNGRAGSQLATFYGQNRLLDNDAFFVAVAA